VHSNRQRNVRTHREINFSCIFLSGKRKHSLARSDSLLPVKHFPFPQSAAISANCRDTRHRRFIAIARFHRQSGSILNRRRITRDRSSRSMKRIGSFLRSGIDRVWIEAIKSNKSQWNGEIRGETVERFRHDKTRTRARARAPCHPDGERATI